MNRIQKIFGEFFTAYHRPRTVHFFSLLGLAIITAIYTWPLLSHLTTAIPGTESDRDVATFIWNNGWIREALQNQKPLLETDAVLLPFGADLRLHTYGLLQGLAAYPFTAWLGVVGAFNLVLVAGLWLNGLAVYALIYDEVKQQAPALVAAVWVMFGTPALVQFRVGRPSFGALWIVALALLAFRRLLARPGLANAIGLGLLLLAALLSDFQIVFYTGLWLGLYGAYWIFSCAKKHLTKRASTPSRTSPTQLMKLVLPDCVLDRQRLKALLISGTIFLIPFFLIYYPALVSAGTGDFPRPGLQGMAAFSFAIRYYVQWQIVPLIYGGYGLFLALLVAILGFRRGWVSGFWVLATGAFLLLALGPFLYPTNIPLPFAGFSLFPMLRQFRTPGRLTIPALIGLGMIAGSLLAAWRPSLPKGGLVWLVVLILVGGRLWFAIDNDPFQIQTYPSYNVYEQLNEATGNFAILEVPFGVRSGLDRIGQGGETLQYYQHIHHKRLLNGMIARLPGEVFAFYRAQPILLFLSGEPTTATKEELRENLEEVLDWSRACYIIVHRTMLTGTEVERSVLAFLDTVPAVEQVKQEADLMIYRVTNTSDCQNIVK